MGPKFLNIKLLSLVWPLKFYCIGWVFFAKQRRWIMTKITFIHRAMVVITAEEIYYVYSNDNCLHLV